MLGRLGIGLSIVMMAGSLGIRSAQASPDSQPLKVIYGNPSWNKPAANTPATDSTPAPAPSSPATPGFNSTAPVTNGAAPGAGYGQGSGSYVPGSGYGQGSGSYMPGAGHTYHLPSAMPNPAYSGPQENNAAAREAEHQRVLENARKAGYSQSRLNNIPKFHERSDDPPGTKYRSFAGITVQDDGLTPAQRLHNITSNGVMNTPIHADKRYYSSGEYGYYKGSGGTMTYQQWLDNGKPVRP